MTLYIHELKRGRLSLIIWSAVISFLIGVCVLIYPEMQSQMGDMNAMLEGMGGIVDAFGMSGVNFGEFIGYFATEFSNTVLLGGSLFAAITASVALSSEESEGTAEFLLTHPISRTQVLISKLLSIFTRIIILNLAIAVTVLVCMLAVGESADAKIMFLMFLAGAFMQIEIGAIGFALSAFMRRGGMAAGLGASMLLYFANILSNLVENTEFLKYITPFAYSDSAKILADGEIHLPYLAVGLLITAAAVTTAFIKYNKKDIA
ncbi:MAG: ABC transporter permease subunit [Clostridia bacterium]|nr:ABC transporter permease subunit [Clostridia bacterium]